MKTTILTIFFTSFFSLLVSNGFGQLLGTCGYDAIYYNYSLDCNFENWDLVFYDEFDGDKLDLTKWQTTDPTNPIGRTHGSSELQYYKDENITVNNGRLYLTAKYEPGSYLTWDGSQGVYKHYDYTSGWIFSKRQFSSGMFEIKCKVPKFNCSFPAFWLYDYGYEWNEIDIFEFVTNTRNTLTKSFQSPRHGLIRDYDKVGSADKSEMCGFQESFNTDYSLADHTYTCIWSPISVEFFIDGISIDIYWRFYYLNYQEVGCTINPNYYQTLKAFPTRPMRIITNLAMNHCQGTTSPNSSDFPRSLEVDYIKYWVRDSTCKGNITIDNSNYFDFDNPDYTHNAVVGENIILGNGTNYVHIPWNGQVDIVANNSIEFGPGFETYIGDEYLDARIDPNVCTGYQKSANTIESETKPNNQDNTLTENIKGSNYSIYPNPTDNIVNITFNQNTDLSKNSLYIYDNIGKLVFVRPSINDYQNVINCTIFPKGIYFVHIVDNITKEHKVHKLIIQ